MRIMATGSDLVGADDRERVEDYHRLSTHRFDRFAPGPETLDWDSQPDPFRSFAGTRRTRLPLASDGLGTGFADLARPGAVAPAPLTLGNLALLLELSLGVSAWKAQGPDCWALRCNPSSGNLHPTEAYVIAGGVPGLSDGVHHYESRSHVLEQRCAAGLAQPGLWIGLGSVFWREAWKYGTRAFRYCQLDTGHALGALRYAAAALGWRAALVEGLDHDALGQLLGTARATDFDGVEAEEPECLLQLAPGSLPAGGEIPVLQQGVWTGRASLLDPHPTHRWPAIDTVAAATRSRGLAPRPAVVADRPASFHPCRDRAAAVILRRRSAQRFTARVPVARDTFFRLAEALMPRNAPPTDLWRFAPAAHPLLFLHRVEGIEPGIYALPRDARSLPALRAALDPEFLWQRPERTPAGLPLFLLAPGDMRGLARKLSCHQAIAGESALAVSLLGDVGPALAEDPWRYRQLHWEAGLLGQCLYLEAEAAGLRGTGIGCFFDESVHAALGLGTDRFRVLYHFTLGHPLGDGRITELPAYPGRSRSEGVGDAPGGWDQTEPGGGSAS